MTTSTAPRLAIPALAAGDILHLILMPTEKCNFRCVYCYEDFAHGRIARPTIDGLRNLLTGRAPTLRLLAIEWFGGEPLLELRVIEEIQEHVQQLARSHPGLRLRASMTTNGYLLSEPVLGKLVRLGIQEYQISIDGSAVAHDARRLRADGAATFDRIWANVLAARDSDLDFKFRLRIHVDRENRGELPSFLETLAERLGGDQRFVVFLRPVSRLGGPRDGTLPTLEGKEVEVVDELRRRARELGLRLPDAGEADACYAAAANSFVIRSTGEIAKCTVAFQHPNNRIGQLHADGTATLDNVKINGWVRGLFSGDPKELRCPMKGFADDRPNAASRGTKALPVVS